MPTHQPSVRCRFPAAFVIPMAVITSALIGVSPAGAQGKTTTAPCGPRIAGERYGDHVPGSPMSASGQICAAGVEVTVTLAGRELGRGISLDDGRFAVDGLVPADLPVGDHVLAAFVDGELVVSRTIPVRDFIELEVTPTHARLGDDVVVSGMGCGPVEEFAVWIHGRQLSQGTTSGGRFAATVTVPRDVVPGPFFPDGEIGLVVIGTCGDVTMSARLAIDPPPPAPPIVTPRFAG